MPVIACFTFQPLAFDTILSGMCVAHVTYWFCIADDGKCITDWLLLLRGTVYAHYFQLKGFF